MVFNKICFLLEKEEDEMDNAGASKSARLHVFSVVRVA